MGITIHLYYTGKGENARLFAQEMTETGVVQAIRAEEGNVQYDYFFPMDDPETVLLIDRWRDQHALDVHHKSPMMETIAQLRKKYGLRLRVERYIDEPKP
ncbi:MAG: putative quinol monooxygenase [Eubacteriales bacterium]|nr:putative quinol monooxygenase [Eubacteriales bacterium]